MEEKVFAHKSVLLNETIEGLNVKADGTYLDGTLGGGGHAYEVVKQLKEGKFYGLLRTARQRIFDQS